MEQIILHIDMDAFFASIEQVAFPEYKNKPVIVGSDPLEGKGRGVVSAASYEARKFGIHSALPISKAYSLCPEGIFVRPRMKRYIQISKKIMNIFYSYSPDIEQISIDEAFLDCTGCQKLFGPPLKIARIIKKDIYKKTLLTASIGIASNKSIAKIASDIHKPDGITICPAGKEKEFLADLDISCLWGAGKKTVKFLNSSGFFKIKDIANKTKLELITILGENGKHLWELSQGIDNRSVLSQKTQQKSIGREYTFNKDTDDLNLIYKQIIKITDTISRELRNNNLFTKTISVKIRLDNFETFTRNFTFLNYINNFNIIKENAINIFNNFDRKSKKIRLIGVSISNFENDKNKQLDLFEENCTKKGNDQILDYLKLKYGKKITRATFLE